MLIVDGGTRIQKGRGFLSNRSLSNEHCLFLLLLLCILLVDLLLRLQGLLFCAFGLLRGDLPLFVLISSRLHARINRG